MKKISEMINKRISIKYAICLLVFILVFQLYIEIKMTYYNVFISSVLIIIILLIILFKKKKRDDKFKRTLEFIAQVNWEEIDSDFLQALVGFLAKECSVKYVFVDEIHGEDEIIATTVALFVDGKIEGNIDYELKYTPCENVFNKKMCVYKDKVQSKFPKDQLLQDMGAESYIGLPLYGTNGKPLGLIAVMDNKKIKNVSEIQALLQLVAIRAGFELEKYIHEEEINRISMFNQSILESVEEGIAVYDKNLKYLMLNEQMAKVAEVDKEDVVGKKVLDVFPFLKDSEIYAGLKRVIQEGVKVESEYEYVNSENRRYFFRDTSEPLFNEEKDVVGVIKKIVDITSYKNTEVELIGLKREADIANSAKSKFLENMSHEIRTPMNGVVGMLELAMNTKEANDRDEYLQTAKKSALTLVNIVNDILVFSSLEENKVVLKNSCFEIRVAIEDINKLLNALIKEKDLKLIIDVSDDVPRIIYGDEMRFKQIWMNLLGNALKFTEAGTISQVVRCISIDDGTLKLKFSVKDTGIGINKEDIELIFERFHQSEQSNTIRYKGSGLGLSISSGLVSLMGGNLQCDSVLGEGSEFSFELSMPSCRHEIIAPVVMDVQNSYSEANQSFKILVVDDDPINNKILRLVLQKDGYSTFVAFNGVEAVEMNGLHQPDIIFMDISMPLKNGYQAMAEIQKNDSHAKSPIIIAQTAFASREERSKCLNAGFDDYISKPIDFDNLWHLMSKYKSEINK